MNITNNRAHEYEEYGYTILRDAITPDSLAKARTALESAIAASSKDLYYQLYSEVGTLRDRGVSDLFAEFNLLRLINLEQHSAFFRALSLSPPIRTFLSQLYGTPPTLLQTLTYAYSSHQGEHSDLRLVSPSWAGNYPRDTLSAAWFALEDADETNGALIIYPGSHKVRKRPLAEFSSYGEYVDYLQRTMADNDIRPEVFRANAGDVLFWSGDFVHAGGIASDRRRTRFSFVCHYAKIEGPSEPISAFFYKSREERSLYSDGEGSQLFL